MLVYFGIFVSSQASKVSFVCLQIFERVVTVNGVKTATEQHSSAESGLSSVFLLIELAHYRCPDCSVKFRQII